MRWACYNTGATIENLLTNSYVLTVLMSIPFNQLPCFVPSFEPTNKFPILIERNREVIDDVMDEEIDENDEDYGNMGCQVSKEGIQN